jgi:cation diffusion facilitator CzcD-associated flavoprotein CzcO
LILKAQDAQRMKGLEALEQRLAEDLSFLELPPKEWVPATEYDGVQVFDTVVIGAGMCGLVATASLKMLGIHNVVCLDRSPQGQEGPWVTFARMETLRSPKQLPGPALGLPALTFRAWYVSQFGAQAWDALGKIPKSQWMDYLIWYRRVLQLPVRNLVTVTGMIPVTQELIALDVLDTQSGRQERLYARHVVLATGRDGLGGGYVPEFVERIRPKFWAHSADEIDFSALKGKRVAVVGAGASAMDNAATALEAGAGRALPARASSRALPGSTMRGNGNFSTMCSAPRRRRRAIPPCGCRNIKTAGFSSARR